MIKVRFTGDSTDREAPIELLDKIERNFAIFRCLLVLEVPPLRTTYETFLRLREQLKTDSDCRLVLDFKCVEILPEAPDLLLEFILNYDPRAESSFFGDSFAKLSAFKRLVTLSQLSDRVCLRLEELRLCKVRPLLILLDIGGSILFRSEHLAPVSRKPDFKLRNHHHYFRPHFEEFICRLIEHPRVKLSFYTSITKRNALPILYNLFEAPLLKRVKDSLFDLFDQDFNQPDGGEGKEKWATKRDLDRVFKHPKIAQMGFGYHNTLMIDSDAEKVRDYPLNSIVIKPYSLAHLLLEKVSDPSEDQTLLQVESQVL